MNAAPLLRLCYGALHVVMQPGYRRLGHTLRHPGDAQRTEELIDWSATMRLRRDLDACGIGVAEAMDTAQRFRIGWPAARRLIAECGALKLANGFCAGAGTDQLRSIGKVVDLVDAVVEQCSYVTSHGGIPVLLPMAWLCEQNAGEETFVDVYRNIVRQVRGPVFVHWLGAMFLPALRGYFPGRSFDRVMDLDPVVVRGCKLSLLDAEFEKRVRRRIAANGQIVLTGDDYHFADLIAGDGMPNGSVRIGEREVMVGDFSHALLGIFDAIARPVQKALAQLAAGDRDAFLATLSPCEALGQHVFAAPVQHYKAGLAFVAWLNGLQDDFALVDGEEKERDRAHYLRCAELARVAGCVRDEATFAARLAAFTADGA